MAPRPVMEYPKKAENTAHRLSDRATYTLPTIHRILAASPILHVSYQPPDSPFPATLPMIGVLASFERPSAGLDEPLDLYLHGYISSRLMQAPVKGAAAATTAEEEEVGAEGEGGKGEWKGLPVTISAAILDGLVLSLTPFSHSLNYRSAIIFGYANPVTDAAEKLFAMERITNSIVPGRWQGTRVPPTAAEMSSTQILRVTITSASAKIRQGGPHDDKHDLSNSEITEKVWTGVVPVFQQFGTPVPGQGNRVREVPGYIGEFIGEENAEAKAEAEARAVDKEGK